MAKNHLPAQLPPRSVKFTRSTAALSNETAKAVFLAKTLAVIKNLTHPGKEQTSQSTF